MLTRYLYEGRTCVIKKWNERKGKAFVRFHFTDKKKWVRIKDLVPLPAKDQRWVSALDPNG